MTANKKNDGNDRVTEETPKASFGRMVSTPLTKPPHSKNSDKILSK